MVNKNILVKYVIPKRYPNDPHMLTYWHFLTPSKSWLKFLYDSLKDWHMSVFKWIKESNIGNFVLVSRLNELDLCGLFFWMTTWPTPLFGLKKSRLFSRESISKLPGGGVVLFVGCDSLKDWLKSQWYGSWFSRLWDMSIFVGY